MFKIGFAEQIVEVPLFAELYGYGPFYGRRNIKTRDPLYCRVFTFRDEEDNRAMFVYTDTCTMPNHYARVMRSELSLTYRIDPECIAFSASHTHTGPLLGLRSSVGSGESDPAYQRNWFEAVRKAAGEAVKAETDIAYAEAGKSPLARKLGRNRVDPAKNNTDESIRWVQFVGTDGKVKVLLHNHGIHGVAINGDFARWVSADWMGAANRMIKEEGLAEMPFFLLGACGDVNTYTSCMELKNDTAADLIASQYLEDLKKGMAAGGEKLTDLSIRGILRVKKFPTVDMTLEEMAREKESFSSFNEQYALRINELMILKEQGHDFSVWNDLQVIRMGELSFFFIPGEYFVEDGAALMAKARGKYPLIGSVSNGNGTYFPSLENMKRFPDAESFHSCENSGVFGFYEIYCCYSCMRMRYADHIASFVADNLLEMEKTI